MASVNDFRNSLNAIVQEYANTSQIELNEIAKNVTRNAARKLKKRSTGDFENQTGAYRKGWRAKRVTRGRNIGRWVVYNATNYQLTHLLEKGHANRNRALPNVDPYPHIKEIELEAIEEMQQEIRERLGR